MLFLVLLVSIQGTAQVKVRGYYRKNGTYVQPHYRSKPDGNPYNNWSYPGNTNPYTGKTATGNPNTYLKNYYNKSSSRSTSYSRSSTSRTTTSSTYKSTPYRRSSTALPTTSRNGYNNVSHTSQSNHYVTANSLNVRSGPSTNYSVIGGLSYADNVLIIASYTNGWKRVVYTAYDVRTDSFKTEIGYVSGRYLRSSIY